jgi:flagellar protein FliO/FliZ
MMQDYLHALLPLALVLALLASAAWLLQKLSKPRLGSKSLLTLQASISVGQRERVVVLEVDGQWLVLGVAPGQVNTLLHLPSPPVVEPQLAQSWLEKYKVIRNES